MKAHYLRWLTRLYLAVVKRLTKSISDLSEFDEIYSITLLLDSGTILELSTKTGYYTKVKNGELLVYTDPLIDLDYVKPIFSLSKSQPYLELWGSTHRLLGVVKCEYYERDQCCNCQYRHLT